MYLREDPIRDAVNGWIGHLFDRSNVERTVTALVASQDNPETGTPGREMCKRRVADAETRLRRLQEAIASGVDPVALIYVINEAQRERAAARAELERAPVLNLLTDAEVYAMIDSLGDVGAALSEPKRDSLANLYTGINLQVLYEPREKVADISCA